MTIRSLQLYCQRSESSDSFLSPLEKFLETMNPKSNATESQGIQGELACEKGKERGELWMERGKAVNNEKENDGDAKKKNETFST